MPPRPRRSCLTVPGSSMRMLEKAAALEVDEVVFDLEDGTAAADKEAARANLGAAGARGTLAVRINGIGTPWWRDDLAAVRERKPDVVGYRREKNRTSIDDLPAFDDDPVA